MFGKSSSHLHVGATTLISKQAEVVGDIHFTGNLEIEGVIRGNILARNSGEASIRILDGGKVVGDIRAPMVIVNGQMEGDIYCSKHLELAAKAQIKGNVYYTFLEVVKGARVNGKMTHQEVISNQSVKAVAAVTPQSAG